MEETPLDLMLSSDPAITPMPIEAWIVLLLMLALVAWGFLSERRDSL